MRRGGGLSRTFNCSDAPLVLPWPMGLSPLLRSALAVILVVLGGGLSTARPLGTQVFTGPDLGRYFQRVWVPEYPYAARRNRVSGRGTYRAYIEPSGKVSRVIVIKSAGLVDLDDAVVRAAINWRARPGKKLEVDFPMAFVASPR
jgi:TonB family protein